MMVGEARTGNNEGYYEKYERLDNVSRKKRRRANPYDPNASKADIDYCDHYGL